MATIADFARVTDNLQYSYQKDHIDSFFSQDVDAFLAHCESVSENDHGGVGYVVQVMSRGSTNGNPTYSSAGTGAPLRSQFTVAPVNMEWKATWTRDAMLAAEAKGLKGMFDLAKEEIDAAQRFAKQSLGVTLGGSGYGELAGIQAVTTGASGTTDVGQPNGVASGTIYPQFTNRFYVGQVCVVADIHNSGNLRGSDPGDSAVVVTINRSTGRITWDTVPATWANGDYIIEKGFRPYAASSGRKCVLGLDAWLDPTIAAGTVGGTVAALHPYAFDATTITTSTIEQQLIAADEFAFIHGLPQEGCAIFCHPTEHRSLVENAIVNRTTSYEVTKERADGSTFKLGYQAFALQGMRGLVPVLPTAFARPGRAFWGPFKDKKMGFKLAYSGKQIMNINTGSDGLAFRMDVNGVTDNSSVVQSGFRAEGFFRGNLLCRHPGNYLTIDGLADTAV
jgi:hypothetical protein